MFPLFSCFQDAWRDKDRRMEIAMKGARQCGGREVHPIKDQTRALKWSLSESSLPLISRVITAEITRNRWTFRHITSIGLKSNGGSKDASFQIKTNDSSRPFIDDRTLLTWSRRFDRWTLDHDRWSRSVPSSDGCAQIRSFKYSSSRRKNSPVEI